MNYTRKQVLRWIDDAMRILKRHGVEYTCHAFEDVSDFRAKQWYCHILRIHEVSFDGLAWDAHFDRDDAVNARMLWLAFLKTWVETGEINHSNP